MSQFAPGYSVTNGSARASTDDLSSLLRFCHLFEPLQEGFLVLDEAGCVLYLNPAAAQMLGKAQQDVLGAVFWSDVLEKQGTEWETQLRVTRETGIARTFRIYNAPSQTWIQGRAEPTSGGLYLYLQNTTASRAISEVVENLQESFILLNRAGDYIYVNREAARLAQRSPDELIGKNAWELYPRTRNSPIYEAISQVFETQQPVFMETIGPSVGIHIAMSFYPQGEYVAIFARDITGEVQARRALEESEALFRTLGETIPLHIWMTDADGRPLYQNPAWQSYTGKTLEELAEMSWQFLHREDDLPQLQQLWEETIRLKKPLELELEMRRHDGAYRWFFYRTMPVKDLEGQVIKWVGTGLDIHERKMVEQSLRESEARLREVANQLRLVTDTTSVLLAQCDRDLRYKFVNRGYAERFGLTPADCIGKRVPEVLGADTYKAILPYIQRVLAGETVEYDIEIFYPLLGDRFWHCSYVPETDKAGDVIGWVAAISDITERRRTEKTLEERNREVGTLNQRLQRAMTETHHRVKNNLQLISAMIDLQRMATEDPIQVAELTGLSDNVRALAVVHDILTQEAKSGQDQETVPAQAVLDRLLQAVEPAAVGRRFVSHIDDVRLTGKQATTLALVTNELTSNAIKHGKGDIEIRFTITGNTAELVVSDDGPGFPDGFDVTKAANTGLELIESVVGWDLRGQVVYGNRLTGGAQVAIRFPLHG